MDVHTDFCPYHEGTQEETRHGDGARSKGKDQGEASQTLEDSGKIPITLRMKNGRRRPRTTTRRSGVTTGNKNFVNGECQSSIKERYVIMIDQISDDKRK